MKHTYEDDPRITAYALGELPDDERAAVEARLAEDPDARAYVEALRGTAAELEAELSAESAVALTAEQRAAIEAAAALEPVAAPGTRLFLVPSIVATALAAGVLAITYAAVAGRAERESPFVYDLAWGGASGSGHSEPPAEQSAHQPPANTNTSVEDIALRQGFGTGEYHESTAGEGLEQLRQLAASLRPTEESELLEDIGVDFRGLGTPPTPGFSHSVREQNEFFGGPAAPGEWAGLDEDLLDLHATTGGGEGARVGAVVRSYHIEPESTDAFGTLLALGDTNEDRVSGAEITGGFPPETEFGLAQPGPVTRFSSRPDDLSLVTPGTEQYVDPGEVGFRRTAQAPLATFAVDVDTASYANARRFLTKNQLPPPSSIRVEELVNYFGYDYEGPDDGRPFGVDVEVTGCPWQPEHRLLRVGLRTKALSMEELPPTNLVFLIDVSGSMKADNKLPLVKLGLELLVDRLREEDSVSIVTYSDQARLALESTHGLDKDALRGVIGGLRADGSTNGAGGIQLAYEQAVQGFAEGGANRVILCSDGDFNVGISDRQQLDAFIRTKATSGVYLTVLGFGMGNLKDANLETLADNGNGGYAYVDSFAECSKVFVQDLGANLVTVAKDAKVQVEFNPAKVAAWRQVGYENRVMAAVDFRNDSVDAGEIGAGHCVTALFEVVPTGREIASTLGVPLRYAEQRPEPEPVLVPEDVAAELCTIAVRWKHPATDAVSEDTVHVEDTGTPLGDASAETRFAVAVAAFALKLRRSRTVAGMSTDDIFSLARAGLMNDQHGHRAELLDLVRAAQSLGLR